MSESHAVTGLPSGQDGASDGPGGSRGDGAAVERLLAAAEAHPLGIDFLRTGYLGAVAATFGVHAFLVEEARRRIGPGAR